MLFLILFLGIGKLSFAQSTLHNISVNAYPKKFTTEVYASVTLPDEDTLTLFVTNFQDQILDTLFDGFLLKGTHIYEWNASKYPTGKYQIKVQNEGKLVSVDVEKIESTSLEEFNTSNAIKINTELGSIGIENLSPYTVICTYYQLNGEILGSNSLNPNASHKYLTNELKGIILVQAQVIHQNRTKFVIVKKIKIPSL